MRFWTVCLVGALITIATHVHTTEATVITTVHVPEHIVIGIAADIAQGDTATVIVRGHLIIADITGIRELRAKFTRIVGHT